MKLPKKSIRDFLNRVLFGATPCSRVSLHLGSTKTEPLMVRCTTPGDYKGSNLDVFVDDIIELIEEDQSEDDDEPYVLKAEWDDDEQPPIASRPIRVRGGAISAASLLSQVYRHNEAVARLNAGMVESIMRHGGVQLHQAQIMAEEASEARMRATNAEQELADRSHERLLEAKREEVKINLLESGMKQVLALLPAVAGKLAGIMPQGATALKASPQYQVIKSMIEEKKPEEWPVLYAWLASYPGSIAEKAAMQMTIESIITEMQATEGEKTNGKAGETTKH